MKTNMGRVSVVAVVALMVLSQTCVYADGEGKVGYSKEDKEARFNKMSEELQLSPQQREQLTRQREEFVSRSKDLREKMKTTRVNLKTELDKPAPDKTTVDNLVAEMKNMAGQQIQNRVDKVMAMKQILTPEQFSKMKDSMKGHKRGKGDKPEMGVSL